ncbi:sensor histidine kinase [Haloimpatiens sp. FM7330]|uniref:sensor histidine kinase n=1 Tax=Haloimpatiens sp. FM7330 TaxID=3298610 RepID=UPI00362518F3
MAIKIKKKSVTLKTVFAKYLISLAVSFGVVTFIVMSFVSLAMKTELIFPANYVENLVRQVKPILVSSPKITKNMIPQGCNFAVLDKNYNVKKTNMNEKELSKAVLYAKGSTEDFGTKKYYFIERKDGFCILQYYIRARYASEWLNKHFPKPEFFMITILLIGCLISTIVITLIIAKKLKSNLVPLMQATEKIKEQDLNFNVGKSKIKEFNDILLSFSDMKNELKRSLEQQWNLEQSRREQISALAHDIKTPLTIVKGNAELLDDTSLDEEQECYTKFILKNANQIEQYVILLNRISKTESELSFSLKKVDMESFVEEISGELTALAISKQIKVEFIKENLPQKIKMDKELFLRCIMNIISNAVEYTPNKGIIKLHIVGNDKNIRFTITDGGKGFSKEALKSATKQFYMGDASRSSKKHFGMGLYIADSIAKVHNGKLILENSPDTKGGRVTVEIPVFCSFIM